jgi:hypothetical protein
MLGIFERAKDECDFQPIRFLQMVHDHGGVETAKRLLAQSEVQAGLMTLWDCGRLDLSMEALVIKPKFQPLFTEEEITIARERLEAVDYFR